MLKVRNILLAFDFSPSSEDAVPYALDLAERFGATLHVLHAKVLHRDPDSDDSGTQTPEDTRSKLEKYIGSKALRKQGYEPEDLNIVVAVERDLEPAPAILNYAEEKEVDCLIIGTHGRRGIRRLLIGSVAEEVVRMAPCAVLSLRKKLEIDAAAIPRTILVPVDYSDHSQLAVEHGRELAQAFGSDLKLVHVVEEFLHPAFYGPGVQSIYDVEPDIEEQAAEHLEEFYADSGGPDVPAEFLVAAGRAGRKISEVAEEEDVDLIVMSTHGRTGMEHFLMGSVASRVVRSAPCAVLSVKPFGRSLIDRGKA